VSLYGVGAGLVVLGCGRIEYLIGQELPPDGGCEAQAVPIGIASGQLAGGFTIQSDASVPGGDYLSPPAAESLREPGDASAEYPFSLSCPAEYLVWGRFHGPDVDHNTLWVSVDGEPFYVWRLSTGTTWFWRAITEGTGYGEPIRYALDAGAHRVTFRNSASNVGLAGIYVAVLGEQPTGNDTPCNPPNSIELEDGGCQKSCGSLGGNDCEQLSCAGRTLLGAYDCTVCCYLSDAGGTDASDAADTSDAPDATRDAGSPDARAHDAGADR
jgi:hypothetical protein